MRSALREDLAHRQHLKIILSLDYVASRISLSRLARLPVTYIKPARLPGAAETVRKHQLL
jgi:hypothetical protein